ncbi:pectin lyase-like protein [Bacteroides phage C2_18_80S2P]|nr:pectin lyase-like protein [Bacteroides phage C2_18_80S2P]
MTRNKDFALLYAGRAVFNKNGEYAGVVVGWNDMHGVILGVEHVDGWQSWGTNDMGVSEEEFTSYEYRNAGMLVEPVAQLESVEVEAPKHKTIGELIKEHEGVRGIQFSTDEHGNVQAAYIRGKHGGMKLVSMGDGLENVSSKI